MKTITINELRNEFKNHIDLVSNSDEVLMVSTGNNEAVIMMSFREYNSLIETHHLLSNPANSVRLYKSLDQVIDGKNDNKNSE